MFHAWLMLQCVCMNILYVCICVCVFYMIDIPICQFLDCPSCLKRTWLWSHYRNWESCESHGVTFNSVDMTIILLRDDTHVCVRQYTATHTTHCNTLNPHTYPWQKSKQDSQHRRHDCQLHTWQDPCICSTIYTHIHTVDMYVKCTYCIMTLNFIRDRTHVYILPICKTRANVQQRIYTRAYCLYKMHTAPYIEVYTSHVYIVEQIHDSYTFRNTWVVYVFDNVKSICPVDSIHMYITLSNRYTTLYIEQIHDSIYTYILHTYAPSNICMEWLRWVGSLKWWVSFAKEPYKRDYILQKRPIILRSLLIVATPYQDVFIVCKNVCLHPPCRWNKDGYIIIFRRI